MLALLQVNSLFKKLHLKNILRYKNFINKKHKNYNLITKSNYFFFSYTKIWYKKKKINRVRR